MSKRCIVVVLIAFSASLATAQQYPDQFKKINGKSGGLTSLVAPGDRFGIMSAAIGDLDDDGVTDMAVGSTNLGAVGAVTIVFMKSNGSAKSSTMIPNAETGEEDSFGSSVCFLGDLNKDGIEDIGVGAQYDDNGGDRAGAFWVLFMNKDGSVKARPKDQSDHR